MGVYVAIAQINDSLYHHGIKGQKWGVRRFQNPDGSLTSEGRKRYSSSTPPNTKLLKNYNGPAYFISSNDSLKNLNPRVPDNFFTKNGYEDSSTPRVSFAPSVLLNQRLSSLELDLNGAYDQTSDYYSGTRYFSDNKNKVFNHFKNLGYDAIPDIEDGGLSSIMAPVIILNPKNLCQ